MKAHLPCIASIVSIVFHGFTSASALAAVRGEAPTVLGDARQVGLAGASLSMPDSIHSAMDNPANSGMEKWAISLAFQTYRVRDDRMNFDGATREGRGRGILASSPRFGIFYGHRLPSQETSGATRIEVQESHLGSAYRVSDRLSLGANLISARADWTGATNSHASTWSAAFGANSIHRRIRYAVAFHPSMRITDRSQSGELSVVEIPWRLSVGAAYALRPDVFLHGALVTFGQQRDARQIAPPYARAGASYSLQPRLGLEYRMVEKDPWALSFYGGTYVEPGRMEGYNARVHTTVGAALGYFSGRASIAYDRAPGYRNFLTFVGIDVLNTLIRLRVFPFLDRYENPKTSGRESPELTPASDSVPRASASP